MTNPNRDQNPLRAERVYRLLLLAYPRAFREAHATEIQQLFREQRREAYERRGRLGLLLLWWPMLSDVLINAALLRLANVWTFRRREVWQDARYALRAFRRNPGFTAVVTLTLALGIGANAAIFSVVNGVLLRPLPFKQPERLLRIYESYQNGPAISAAYRSYVEWRARNHAFESIGAATPYDFNLESSEEPERLSGAKVTASWFDALGIPPMLGRTFTPEECQSGRDQVVVLSHALWQRRFGGDAHILGQPIRLHGRTHTVIGVMPPTPFYPVIEWHEIWTPLAVANESEALGERRRWLGIIARLKPDSTPEQAQTELSSIHRQLTQEFPATHSNYSTMLRPLHEVVVGRTQTALLILLGAVGFVLLIACANVANLLLVRATAREKEMAIRSALGADRARLVRQMLTESVLLALGGAAGGLALAYGGLQLLICINPDDLPRIDEISLDGHALAFTFALALLTGVIFGLVPALTASKPALGEMLKDASRGTSGGRQRFRRALIVSEVALALVLLVGAGLLLKSFVKLLQVEPGFRAAQILTVEVTVPSTRYKEAQQRAAIYHQVLERLEILPGVAAVGAISTLPLRGTGSNFVFIEGQPLPASGQEQFVSARIVTPDYFRALGISLLVGRTFTAQETWQTGNAIIINQAMAQRFWPNGAAIGKRLKHNRQGDWLTVVGVVGNVRQRSLSEEAQAETYSPPAASASNVRFTFVIHAQADPASLVSAIRAQVRAVEPNVALAKVMTMERVVEESMAQPRLWGVLIGIFALVAMALAAVGIYGVVAYTVSQRKQEIGIRLALGAKAGDVIKLVVGEGVRPVLLGLALGLLVAFALMRVLRTLLFGVSVTDPLTFTGVAALLATVALAASLIPARRALKNDPMSALRSE